MKKKDKKNEEWGAGALLVAAGILVGFVIFWVISHLFQIHDLDSWSLSTDPIGNIISVITLIAAFTIFRTFQSRDAASAKIRELFTQYLSEFREDFRAVVSSIVVKKDNDALQVIERTGRFRERMRILIGLGEKSKFFNRSNLTTKNLLITIDEVRNLLTNTARTSGQASTADAPIVARNGLVTYSETRKSEVANKIYEIDQLIFELSAEIYK